MTTLISWTGVDSHQPASVYIASDSRLSSMSYKWDFGKKVFASIKNPDILGFAGDSNFCSVSLGQIIHAIDTCAFYQANSTPSQKASTILDNIQNKYDSYPTKTPLTVFFATRSGHKLNSTFHFFSIKYNTSSGWSLQNVPMPNKSSLLEMAGSGSSSFDRWHTKWKMSPTSDTSRNIFFAFGDALLSRADHFTGGPPQLVGLYRDGPAKSFGIVWKGEPWYQGTLIDNPQTRTTITWFNENFEVVDATSLQKLPSAQRQPKQLR